MIHAIQLVHAKLLPQAAVARKHVAISAVKSLAIFRPHCYQRVKLCCIADVDVCNVAEQRTGRS